MRRKNLHFLIAGLQPAAPILAGRIAIPLLLLTAGLMLVQPSAGQGTWTATDSLKTARFHHTATLLSDGRVLVAGGAAGVGGERPLKSAELYDPATGTWSDAASLKTARDSNTATLLPNGMVLVAAGRQSGIYLTSAELYDPAADTWSLTGSLDTGRVFHTATLLPNGMVLVVGGIEGDIYLASAELYDPATGNWSPTGSLITAREFHTETLLPNGKVLVAGGRGPDFVELASAELYDPTTGSWSATGSLNTARYDHTATLLPNGMVLVAGGEPEELDSAELYDPATGTWSVTGSLNDGRADHVETLLLNGMVLVADGTSWDLSSAELYDPASGTWSLTGSLNQARKDHAATLLLNGMVLVTGGAFAGGVPLASAELYDPGIVAATKVDGRGTFDNQGNQVTFTLHASQAADSSTLGSFSFCDPADACVTKGKIRTLSISGNTAGFSGQGRLDDGTRVSFNVSVTDNGSPGPSDTISITLDDGYSAGGTLTSGDIRIY